MNTYSLFHGLLPDCLCSSDENIHTCADDLDDQYVNVNLDDGDFCAEESLMSPPRALDLKTLKLEWPRKCDRPKILFSNYYKEIMLWNIR
jgi:hypothetical protein